LAADCDSGAAAAGDLLPDRFVFDAERAGFFFVERAGFEELGGAPIVGGGGGGSSPATDGVTSGG
jgi:hypothetical protein